MIDQLSQLDQEVEQYPDEVEESGTVLSALGPALRSRGISPEQAKYAAGMLGSIVTEKKTESSRRNILALKEAGIKGGRKRKELSDVPCTCGRSESLEGHPTTCPRGHLIWRRKKAGEL